MIPPSDPWPSRGCFTASATWKSSLAGDPAATHPRRARHLTQLLAVERDQPLPMPLGGRLVIAPALGEREAVVDAHIHLDLPRRAGALEQGLQLPDHRQRRQLVMLGAGDVHLALDLAEIEVRALLGVADQPGAVERRRGGDPVGIARRGVVLR